MEKIKTSISLSPDVDVILKQMAKDDRRSASAVVEILILNAAAARKVKGKKA